MAASENPLQQAEESFQWYVDNSRSSRLRYQVSEVVLLVVASAVPIAVIVSPGNAKVPAVLGATVVALSGLRAVFHWHDNWTRFSMAAMSIKAERRLYLLGAEPYDDPATRDHVLIRNVNGIESKETSGWMTLAAPGSGPSGKA